MLLKRYILLIIIHLLYVHSIRAQDGIILLRGDTIFALIIKVTPAEITFNKPGKWDSVSVVSTDFVKKLIYANGKEEIIYHFNNDVQNNDSIPGSKMITRRGNTYFYRGGKIEHEYLEAVYLPLKDKELTNLYYRGMNMKHGSTVLIYSTIPIGGIGYCLFVYSLFPTNLSRRNGGETNYGNSNLAVPGALMMGSALLSAMGGIIMHNYYKVNLQKAAKRYNLLISNQ